MKQLRCQKNTSDCILKYFFNVIFKQVLSHCSSSRIFGLNHFKRSGLIAKKRKNNLEMYLFTKKLKYLKRKKQTQSQFFFLQKVLIRVWKRIYKERLQYHHTLLNSICCFRFKMSLISLNFAGNKSPCKFFKRHLSISASRILFFELYIQVYDLICATFTSI